MNGCSSSWRRIAVTYFRLLLRFIGIPHPPSAGRHPVRPHVGRSSRPPGEPGLPAPPSPSTSWSRGRVHDSVGQLPGGQPHLVDTIRPWSPGSCWAGLPIRGVHLFHRTDGDGRAVASSVWMRRLPLPQEPFAPCSTLRWAFYGRRQPACGPCGWRCCWRDGPANWYTGLASWLCVPAPIILQLVFGADTLWRHRASC